jgi:hypothetical protein
MMTAVRVGCPDTLDRRIRRSPSFVDGNRLRSIALRHAEREIALPAETPR